MRKYLEKTNNNLDTYIEKLVCNKCGKEIKVVNGIVKEGVFMIDYDWGYFSHKDGERHSFDLCEECYNLMISEFKFPATRKENTELI
ncbi:MAG: hypothetical protein ACI4DS_01025 [Eubacterium sp.]